jgi:hypothetical protein
MGRSLLLLLLPALVLVPGCRTPGATALASDEEHLLVAAESAPSTTAAESAPAAEPAPDGAAAVIFRQLTYKGVNGGEGRFIVDGTPEEVALMLVDFNRMTGRRPWAAGYTHLSTDGDLHRSEWSFAGKAGVNPKCVLVHRVERKPDAVVVRFSLEKTDFGLAAFFGDYRLVPAFSGGRRTLVTERIFIDSGVLIANATAEDIEAAVRQDAADMGKWMRDRLVGAGGP